MNHAELSSYIRSRLQPVAEKLKIIPGLPEMFLQCFTNTLDTTVQESPDGTAFVITGDIPAMWLRDSASQVMHYIRFCDHAEVAAMIRSVLARQCRQVLHDPYANAFTRSKSDKSIHQDQPPYKAGIWERKYEVDSLCAPLYLAQAYYDKTGDTSILTPQFHQMMQTVTDVFTTEQHHESSPYYFVRMNCPASDTLPENGHGTPVTYTGMTWSGFRPSDDACRYGYLIPANLMACKALESMILFAHMMGDQALKGTAEKLCSDIHLGILAHGIVNHPQFGEIYAYETDGAGHYHLMDDANVPSLLSLPYLGVCSPEEPVYLRTRSYVLSAHNPYYFCGDAARGIGSPHTPDGFIWPISLCIQLMTATSAEEKAACLKLLLSTHAGTGFMHESFHRDDPARFTRSWFAWANSLFGETIMRTYEEGLLDDVLRLAT